MVQRWQRAIGLLLCVLAGTYVWTHFRVSTDVMDLLPGSEREGLAVERRLANSGLGRTMILLVEGAPPETEADVSQRMEALVRAEGGDLFERIDAGPPSGMDRAMFELYHPRRLLFFAPTVEEAERRLSDEGLSKAASALRDRLLQPLSPLVNRVAPGDPFLVLPELFETLEGSQAAGLAVDDGRFVTRETRSPVLFVVTRAGAMDVDAQRMAIAALERAEHRLREEVKSPLVFRMTGASRYALQNEAAMKRDMARVGTFSAVGLVALLLVVFRSLRLSLLTVVPMATGLLFGTLVSLLCFGRVHGLALAFGGAMLGQVSDYPIHLYCHQAATGQTKQDVGRSTRMALVMCGLTTVLGVGALIFSGAKALLEVGVFASAGLMAALVTSVVWLPSMLPASVQRTRALDVLVSKLRSLHEMLQRGGTKRWLIPAALVAITLAGLPLAHIKPALFAPEDLGSALKDEDAHVRAALGQEGALRLIVATGKTEADALTANAEVAAALEQAKRSGELSHYATLARMLPPPDVQEAVARTVGQANLQTRFAAPLREAGFVPDAFAPFLRHLDEPLAPPLTADMLFSSPAGNAFRSLVLDDGGVRAFVSHVGPMRNMDAVVERIAKIPGAEFVDQGARMRSLHRGLLVRTLQAAGWGMVAIALLLVVRYRSLPVALAAMVPAAIGCAAAVSVMALFGYGIDAIVVAALLLVVSIGVDYGIMLIHGAEGSQEDAVGALLSVVVAGLSTILGFGVLSFAEHPILRSIGLTSTLGVTFSALLAPLAVMLVRGKGTPIVSES